MTQKLLQHFKIVVLTYCDWCIRKVTYEVVSCESGVELIAIVALTNSGKSCLSYQCLKKKKKKEKEASQFQINT